MIIKEHLCYNECATRELVSARHVLFNNLIQFLRKPSALALASHRAVLQVGGFHALRCDMKQKCTWCGGSLESVREGTYRCVKCWAEFITADKRQKQIELINRNRPEPTPKFKKAQIPDTVRWAVWERDNFTCKHCGTRRNLAVDHIYPESLGGETTVENCQTLCRSCNSRKGAR